MSQRIEYGAIRCENTVTFVKSPALPVYTVETAPAATLGLVAIFSDGAAGNICFAFADGTNWIRSDTVTFVKPPALPVYTVETAPAATLGLVAIFSDGAAGNICLAFADGTNWIRSDTNTAIADS